VCEAASKSRRAMVGGPDCTLPRRRIHTRMQHKAAFMTGRHPRTRTPSHPHTHTPTFTQGTIQLRIHKHKKGGGHTTNSHTHNSRNDRMSATVALSSAVSNKLAYHIPGTPAPALSMLSLEPQPAIILRSHLHPSQPPSTLTI
jgi:hypothetical protein